MRYLLQVNGGPREVDVPAGTPLLAVLRDTLGLTGARFGCGHGACGACVVLAEGAPIPACTTAVEDVAGRAIVTIEGLARGDELHPVQRAFLQEGALQCGYCTSGMILAGAALLQRVPSPSEDQIREALAPHLCRCGVYLRAIRAIQRAAR
jgi:aerobic-type carbon monoxide dehydrogenase small subunit (CoxS/CutS family)